MAGTNGAVEVGDEKLQEMTRALEAERSRADTERARAEAAERRTRALAGRAATEIDARVRADEEAADAAIAANTAEADRLEAEAAALMEEGKFREATAATRKAGAAEFKAEQARERKVQIAAWKERQAERAAQAAEGPAQPEPVRNGSEDDPRLANFTPRTRDWIKAHPEFLSNDTYRNKATAAHYKALADGIKPDTDAYFAFVETEIGERKAAAAQATEVEFDGADPGSVVVATGDENEEEPVIETPPPKPKPAAAAAPPSRRAPVTRPAANGKVHLTSAQAEAALLAYGPDSPHKLTAVQAYRKYAEARQNLLANPPNSGEIH